VSGGPASLFDLAGASALVTGAGRGIGRAMSVALAQAGASVLATDLDPSAAAETQRLLGGPVELVGQPLDVTDPASIAAGIEHLVSATGRLDILVNNAGINIGNDTPAEDLDPEVWRRVLDVNATGPFLCSQQAARQMIPQGRGKIINVASAAAVIIPRLHERYITAYSTSKAAVVMLTRSLALQWARHGITVNAISPTYTDTDLIQRDERRMAQMVASSPFERLGQTSDLTGALIYLASPASDFTTGHNMLVDGGFSL
jgi:NAD(P)-dependent dehydrogenase (short-subunit alcohol dehydrogenase family)